jgi:hypothetical protein
MKTTNSHGILVAYLLKSSPIEYVQSDERIILKGILAKQIMRM